MTATPLGLADSPAERVTLVVAGEAMRPPGPVHLNAIIDPTGNLNCTWCRRSRRGWAWLDGVDAPLGASREAYRLRVEGSLAALEAETNTPAASFTVADLATLGPGPITLSVVQVGDLAVSRPATLTIG